MSGDFFLEFKPTETKGWRRIPADRNHVFTHLIYSLASTRRESCEVQNRETSACPHRLCATLVLCGVLMVAVTAPGICLGQDGLFTADPAWSSGPANATRSVAVGDVDGDGDVDLVCGNTNQSNTIYLNTGGTFSTLPAWSSALANNTASVALGDVNGDGDLDLVCGNVNQSNALHLNTGGTFSTLPAWASGPANDTRSVALGDVDGDGDLDLVCGNVNQSNMLYLNTGGTFSSLPAWASGPANATTNVALGDVDGDGDLDLVCGNSIRSNTLYLNTGGTFSVQPAWASGPANDTRSVALGDVDGDGDLDLVCGNSIRSNTLYLNTGGTFSVQPAWASGPANDTRSVALGDVDGNGDLDLVCGNSGSNTLFLNTGGTFSTLPAWSSGPANATQGVALGDVDGDSDLDLVCGNSSGNASNTLYLNTQGVALTAQLDIKPGSCPNPFNTRLFEFPAGSNPRSGGVLPVAVLGSDEFDVSQIDVSTLRLEGVEPVMLGGGPKLEDIATALDDGSDCLCTDEGPDGFTDLKMKFRAQEIAAAVLMGARGETRVLTLTGELLDGTPFEATDCVVFVGPAGGVAGASDEPTLNLAFPNPFNPVTRISYVLPRRTVVGLSVYDVQGKLVERLAAGVKSAGEHVVEWDAKGRPSGIYFYRLIAGDYAQTRKLILLK